MEQKVEKMNTFFGERIAACEERERALSADGRCDEANFEKVRANIYDVFRTILAVAVKTQADEAGVRAFFAQKAEQIPAGWKAAYEAARQHEDAETMRIEQIKLEAAAEIQAFFEQVWGNEE